MAEKKSTRPKIKENLPEKLPAVEPEESKDMVVTEEKGVKTIEEDFISKEELAEEEGFVNEDDVDLSEGQSEPKAGEITIEKEINSDKLGAKAEQPFLFGEADQILNALETELTTWKSTLEKLFDADGKLQTKMKSAAVRIESLEAAIKATRKHAPMKEDPAPPEKKKKIVEISHPTSISEEMPVTTTSSDEPEKLQGIKGIDQETWPHGQPTAVAEGAAERDADLAVKFREGTIPVPEVLFPGDKVKTSWNTGPYNIESIAGPFHAATIGDEEVPSPAHYSLQCSEVKTKRNKDGKLPKDYDYYYLNLVVAVGNRFLSVFEESKDEVYLQASAPVSTATKDPKQEKLPNTAQEEELY